MKGICLIIGLFLTIQLGAQPGIIIGKDSLVQNTFQKSSPGEISALTNKLSQRYSKVVLHLGRKFPFGPGGFYQSAKSQQNLKQFAEELNSKGVELHFWFLDSYGSAGFKELYKEHHEIIDNLVDELSKQSIPYQGLAVDMEWINRGGGSNSKRFIEILTYLKKRSEGKQVHAFASIIDVPNHNLKRGYDETKIANLIDGLWPMLYPVDGGFHKSLGKIKPWVRDIRIDSMYTYFTKQQYEVVVSAEPVLLKKSFSGVKTLASPLPNNAVFEDLKKKGIKEYHHYTLTRFKAQQDTEVTNRKGETVRIRRNKKVFYFQVKPQFVQLGDWVWEYTYVQ